MIKVEPNIMASREKNSNILVLLCYVWDVFTIRNKIILFQFDNKYRRPRPLVRLLSNHLQNNSELLELFQQLVYKLFRRKNSFSILPVSFRCTQQFLLLWLLLRLKFPPHSWHIHVLHSSFSICRNRVNWKKLSPKRYSIYWA